jgi:hypothetical protein
MRYSLASVSRATHALEVTESIGLRDSLIRKVKKRYMRTEPGVRWTRTNALD